MASYDQVLRKVLSLDRRGIFLGLEAISRALKIFNQPHQKFPSVLVAGTNGKGSTVSMLSTILSKAGYRVGTVISPHLLDIRERIQVNQRNISRKEFACLAIGVQKRIDKYNIHLTFFEFLTVMAFCHFARQRVDIAVVEVGLGGRLDATNVLTPLLSVITTIGIDHQRFLGRTLKEIATEKAGIIKKNGCVVTSVVQKPIRAHIRRFAIQRNARFYALGENFSIRCRTRTLATADRPSDHILCFKDSSVAWKDLRLSLQGEFQKRNAAAVLKAISLLKAKGWRISEASIREGLMKTHFAGRMETAKTAPRLLLDSAHNIEGIRTLMRTIQREYHFEKLYLVLGIMKDKNYPSVFNLISKVADEIYFVEPAVHRALTGEQLLERLPFLENKIHLGKDIASVLPGLIQSAKKQDMTESGVVF